MAWHRGSPVSSGNGAYGNDGLGLFRLADYQSAIAAEVDFLRAVADFDWLSRPGHVLSNAVRRYETLWLPLLGRLSDADGRTPLLVPPLDVYWVWHCHMLSPVNYRRDCASLAGVVLDHVVRWLDADQIAYSRRVWSAEFPEEPYDMSSLPTLGVTPQQAAAGAAFRRRQNLCDLEAACIAQGTFFYSVSLPHYKDRAFVESAVLRYRKFLYLRRRYPDRFVVPCHDIALVWHAHMLHPLIYAADTASYLGGGAPLEHDDAGGADCSVAARWSGGGGDAATAALWRELFGEEMVLAGSAYRGVPPGGWLATMRQSEVSAMRPRSGTAVVESITVERPPSRRTSLILSTDARRPGAEFARRAESRHLASGAVIISGDPLARMPFTGQRDETLRVKLKRKRRSCVAAACLCLNDEGGRGGEYVSHCRLLRFLPPDGGDVGRRLPFSVQRQAGSATLRLDGFAMVEELARQVVLELQPGFFEAIRTPKRPELLWGPTPFAADATDGCIAATHRLLSTCLPDAAATRFRVRVVHCLPLKVCAVQVFAASDDMVALSHVVGQEQLPDGNLPWLDDRSRCVTMNSQAGEKGFVIKNASGDWGFVFGAWRKGLPHGGDADGGSLRVRFARLRPSTTVVETVVSAVRDDYTLKLPGVCVNLRSGEMTLDYEEVAEEVALSFTVAALLSLCQTDSSFPLSVASAAAARPFVTYELDGRPAAAWHASPPRVGSDRRGATAAGAASRSSTPVLIASAAAAAAVPAYDAGGLQRTVKATSDRRLAAAPQRESWQARQIGSYDGSSYYSSSARWSGSYRYDGGGGAACFADPEVDCGSGVDSVGDWASSAAGDHAAGGHYAASFADWSARVGARSNGGGNPAIAAASGVVHSAVDRGGEVRRDMHAGTSTVTTWDDWRAYGVRNAPHTR